MRYMFLVYEDEAGRPPLGSQVWNECIADGGTLRAELEQRGIFGGCAPLHNADTATTVRVRDEKTYVIDGPFAETKEQLGGYWIADFESEGDALAFAARIPAVERGCIEVRPLVELP